MKESLSEDLKQMIVHANYTLLSGDKAKTEELLIALIKYSREHYHPGSATTGLVMIAASRLYHKLGKQLESALLIEQARTIAAVYKHPGRFANLK